MARTRPRTSTVPKPQACRTKRHCTASIPKANNACCLYRSPARSGRSWAEYIVISRNAAPTKLKSRLKLARYPRNTLRRSDRMRRSILLSKPGWLATKRKSSSLSKRSIGRYRPMERSLIQSTDTGSDLGPAISLRNRNANAAPTARQTNAARPRMRSMLSFTLWLRIPCLARKSNGYFGLSSGGAEERRVELHQLAGEFLFPAGHPLGTQPQLAEFSGPIQHHQPGPHRPQCDDGKGIDNLENDRVSAHAEQQVEDRIAQKINGKNHAVDDDVAAQSDGVLHQQAQNRKQEDNQAKVDRPLRHVVITHQVALRGLGRRHQADAGS